MKFQSIFEKQQEDQSIPEIERCNHKTKAALFNTEKIVLKLDAIRELQATKVKRNGLKRFIRYGTRSFVWSK